MVAAIGRRVEDHGGFVQLFLGLLLRIAKIGYIAA